MIVFRNGVADDAGDGDCQQIGHADDKHKLIALDVRNVARPIPELPLDRRMPQGKKRQTHQILPRARSLPLAAGTISSPFLLVKKSLSLAGHIKERAERHAKNECKRTLKCVLRKTNSAPTQSRCDKTRACSPCAARQELANVR